MIFILFKKEKSLQILIDYYFIYTLVAVRTGLDVPLTFQGEICAIYSLYSPGVMMS